VQGPTGASGPAGPSGISGPGGPSGPSGPQGVSGPQGAGGVAARTLWFASSGNQSTAKCLGHQDAAAGNAACGTTGTADFATRYEVVTGGNLTSLWAEVQVATTTGNTQTATVRVNGAATALTCDVPVGKVTCEVSASVAVVTGNQVDVQITTTQSAKPWKTYVTLGS
jgi:hypothetical protein